MPHSNLRLPVSLFVVLLVVTIATPSASAQTFTVLHNFTAGQDGSNPWGGLTIDAAGNLYGTATTGGSSHNCQGGCGAVFKLSHSNSGWTLRADLQLQQDGRSVSRRAANIRS